MYQYTPNYTRKKEMLITTMLFCISAILITVSRLEGAPLPALWQFAAFVLLSLMITVIVRFLIRSYTYRVAPREDGVDRSLDLTVIERTGKREQVVCRVSLWDIETAERQTAENRRALKEKRQGKRTWYYYTELSAPDLCQLTVQDGKDIYFVMIQADQTLFGILQKQ